MNSWRKVADFASRQKRSLAKRRAELRDMVIRGSMRAGLTRRFRSAAQDYAIIDSSGLLDQNWYRDKYKHLVSSAGDAVLHYVVAGAAQGCDPNPVFYTRWYLDQHPELRASGRNPLVHYITTEWKHGGQPNPKFDPGQYARSNPDAVAAGADPLTHYLTIGLRENRPLSQAAQLHFSHDQEQLLEPFTPDVRLLAFYLPQFHRIPENDLWWGEGFTEWTNVRRGKPLFAGHYQPQVPHPNVGYYDLTESAVLERQAEMAGAAGIHGFCFHHYWFGGKRLLEMPTERLLKSGRPDFPFCLCWANENWSRRWNGDERDLLIAQRHSPEDDERFMRDLLRFFADRRYIRVGNRPLLLLYRPSLLPDLARTVERWRRVARTEAGFELFVAGVQTFDFLDPQPAGFDAVVEFPPYNVCEPLVSRNQVALSPGFRGSLFDYAQIPWAMGKMPPTRHKVFRGVMPSWDNTARRRERASVFLNANPETYFEWLSWAIKDTRARLHGDERLVFVNAWNEWAEGCHLEPDERDGYAWLNATRQALKG